MVEREQALFFTANVEGTEEKTILERLDELELKVNALEVEVSQIVNNTINEEDIDLLFEV